MGRPRFDHADFLAAALAIAAEHGPSAVTIAALSDRLGAPTGSFYHRFASRSALLGALWLRTVRAFGEGVRAALDSGDGLAAVLHTPAWVRTHPHHARLLLLHHRDDFVQGDWPAELREEAADLAERGRAGTARFARLVFGTEDPQTLRRSEFLLAEAPVAAVRQHILRREPPPPLVDAMLRATYRAVVADHRRARRAAPPLSPGGSAPC
ncbi:MAG: TetR/AcrR family transcriptional regulator [Acetobacteraceae bacterium]|nr:TetR/AcrR family transcriptional regulator [Acetobacteraceae bacterium]